MKIYQRAITGGLAALLCRIAYRKTRVPHSTEGHRHRFISLYLTWGLNLETKNREIIKATFTGLTLWVVPPREFHKWVTNSGHPGEVYDLTPFHRPHRLITPLHFLTLTASQLRAFANWKSDEELQSHGPLKPFEQVGVHRHTRKALYVVSHGSAACLTGKQGVAPVLSVESSTAGYNAVLVDAGADHGWLALPGVEYTIIEHVFGDGNVNAVLAAA